MAENYREWSEMKAEGIEVETMQEWADEMRGFHDYPPEPMDAEDYEREYGARDAYYEEQAERMAEDGMSDDEIDQALNTLHNQGGSA